MKPFSLLIKPACADCNLRCRYCFYLRKGGLYPESARHRMTEPVLERLISTFMATDQPQYTFGWQGGEPTLMGVEFFRRANALQEKHGRSGSTVANGVQTNATRIDDELARHFAEYNFLLGVSLDGPPEIHDVYRKNAAGRGSHADVLRGIECLRRNGVEFNILVLVNHLNVGMPGQVYRYLRDSGFLHHQYIPCVEFDAEGRCAPFGVSGEQWGDFLCGIYDEWIREDTREVSVRQFDSVLSYLVDGVHNVCQTKNDCRQYLVVEHNGDVYPCDFFVESGLKLGNVMGDSWETFLASDTYREFGRRKIQWDPACAECRFRALCAGDCPKHRPGEPLAANELRLPGADGQGGPRSPAPSLSVLCPGWQRFYAHTLDGFAKLAAQIREQRRSTALHSLRLPVPSGAAGRNDPCPCGSGLKHKKCCLGR